MAELRTAKTLRLQNMRRDKSFRIIADVDLDGRSLAKILLDGGYAKPWFGESRPRWENPPVRP
jgi:micrococcal nuclease